jgi:hypothetical protein
MAYKETISLAALQQDKQIEEDEVLGKYYVIAIYDRDDFSEFFAGISSSDVRQIANIQEESYSFIIIPQAHDAVEAINFRQLA